MTALSPLNIPTLLRQHGLRADKAMGQNFLVDEEHLSGIVTAAGIKPDDQVLEVGAGLGSLTRHLAAAAKRVVAVELDGKLLPILRDTVAGYSNVQIVHGDILRLKLADYFQISGFLVVANIPYYLTSNLIRHLLENDPRPSRLALTVQREVAERACAKPPQMSLLALSIQVYGSPKIVHRIPSGAFFPKPKVDSAVLVVDLYAEPRLPADQLEAFFRLAKGAFSQKRKTLANSLASLPGWQKKEIAARLVSAGIDPQRRPQTLNLEEWGRLI